MWLRGLPGLVICALGVVWFLQGVDVLHGSGMTGRHQYAVLGAVAIVVGAGFTGMGGSCQTSPGEYPVLIAGSRGAALSERCRHQKGLMACRRCPVRLAECK